MLSRIMRSRFITNIASMEFEGDGPLQEVLCQMQAYEAELADEDDFTEGEDDGEDEAD